MLLEMWNLAYHLPHAICYNPSAPGAHTAIMERGL
jgi:hypothetical protein